MIKLKNTAYIIRARFGIDKMYFCRYMGFTPLQDSPFQYGAVRNPVTGEIYPIYVEENFETVIQPPYEYEENSDEMKPTDSAK